MSDSQIAVTFGMVAILVTAGLLFRQQALGWKALIAVIVSTAIIGGFIFITLTDVAG
jgi:hypothetical protein